MSNTTVYPLDPAVANPIYEQARTDAKARAAQQWMNENFNMWTTYNTVLNPDWVDPWYEHELGGIYNGPSTGGLDPAYEMTQNLYMIFCWLKYKGYGDYALTALTTGTIQSSTMTGGLWQSYVHPYSSLIGFNAAAVYPNNEGRSPWFVGSSQATWQASAWDEYLQQTVYLDAPAGSWAAVRRSPIAMEFEEIGGTIYYRPDYNPLRLVWSRTQPNSGGYDQATVGYGLVQWTNYSDLVTEAGLTTPEGSKHWQLNLTLQLMVLEYERNEAMTHPTQSGGDYHGQWVDTASRRAYITINNTDYYYPYASCTWNDWRDDKPVQLFETYMHDVHGIELSLWDKIHIMMDIFRCCYLQTAYADFGFETKSRYVWNAIQYWKNHGGWDVKDIPRARDIPECELDQYHISAKTLLLMMGRRKKKGVRTILL